MTRSGCPVYRGGNDEKTLCTLRCSSTHTETFRLSLCRSLCRSLFLFSVALLESGNSACRCQFPSRSDTPSLRYLFKCQSSPSIQKASIRLHSAFYPSFDLLVIRFLVFLSFLSLVPLSICRQSDARTACLRSWTASNSMHILPLCVLPL